MSSRAFISGVSGLGLTVEEAAFFRDAQPWGFILFKRNTADPAQTRALVDQLRSAVGWHAPVLIDQEGGARSADGAAKLAQILGGADISDDQ